MPSNPKQNIKKMETKIVRIPIKPAELQYKSTFMTVNVGHFFTDEVDSRKLVLSKKSVE